MKSTSAPAILILGGGIMQLPAVRIAKRKGWRVVVAAQDIGQEIRALADRCLQVDLRDGQAVLESVRRAGESGGLDGVFTAGTDFSTTVAWVAAELGLPGISYESALDATDKARMRAAFDRHGVPSPRFFTAVHAGQGLPQGFELPLVVKPVDNMGARGVRRVESLVELRQALQAALLQSACGRAIVEEYLEGPELSLDAVVHRGRVTVCGVADRHICFPPFFVEMGHTMPSRLSRKSLREVEEVFVRGIAALGIREGAAKGDIKVTARGPVVGEIAARLSGGYMSGWTYPLASGVEVTAAALNLALGLPPGDLQPRRRWVSAERAFISIPGRVSRLEGLEQARWVSRIEEVFLRFAPGQQVELPVNNLGKGGNVISAAPSRSEAVSAAEAAVRRVLVRLEPGNAATEEFLAGERQAGFRAFAGAGHALAERIAALPPLLGEPAAARGGASALALLPLEGLESESVRDWHGCSLAQALARVAEGTGVSCLGAAAADRFLLGGLFWRALLKGSFQAGIYLIDTLCSAASDPKQVVKRWMSRL